MNSCLANFLDREELCLFQRISQIQYLLSRNILISKHTILLRTYAYMALTATTRTLLYQKAIVAQQLPRALAATVGGTRKFAAAASSAPTAHEWPNHSGLITTASFLRKNDNYGKYAAIAAGLVTAQYFLGEKEEFFDYRFTTDKKPEDLADFYGHRSLYGYILCLSLHGYVHDAQRRV